MPRHTRWLLACVIAFTLILTLAIIGRVFAGMSAWQITVTLDVFAVLALLAAVVLRFRDRKRRAYVTALERVNEAALAIASTPGELEPLLDRLASVARDLLSMPTSRIMLLTPDRQSFRQVHCFGHIVMTGEHDFPVSQASGAQECLRTSKPVIVEDIVKDPGPSSVEMARQLGVRSLLLMPLIATGEIIGIMALTDSTPRTFTHTQRQLADLLAAHVAVSIANARLYGRMEDAIRSLRRVQAQRDTLYTMSTAVQRARTVDESLARIVELAPSSLEIDVCVVLLANDTHPAAHGANAKAQTNGQFRVAAVTRLPYPFPVSVGLMDSCDNFTRVMKRCKPHTVEDTEKDPSLARRGIGPATGVGSVLYMPLMAGGSVAIGVLSLMRRATGSFPVEMVRLAEMFSARAATAIENARLNDQASRDAETKATLLHELNHRVKNNLSGLIGLLSMGTPPLAPEAQRWLERVIERIGALARAHELFSMGREVRLGELINTTLDSIAAIKPDDVRVAVDIGADDDAVLPATIAVPAAMVVYELAYNAIVHGVRESGRLDVRVRKSPASQISIEVIDDGGGDLDESAVSPESSVAVGVRTRPRSSTSWATALHQGTGVGLSLVRGLVARELRGQFDIRSNDSGGTTASVTFPLNRTTNVDVGKIASTS